MKEESEAQLEQEQIESGIDISDEGMDLDYDDNYNLENTCQRERKQKEEKLIELKSQFN